MQPQMKSKIEKATRKAYPEGIAPHGTDALRFTFAALASPSRDIRFDLARVAGYRNFCNKLWNAARFVMLSAGQDEGQRHDEGQNEDQGEAPRAARPDGSCGPAAELSVADRWIRSRFGRTVEAVQRSLADYRFDYAAAALYEFTWHEFCDWYLELTKPVLQSDSSSSAARAGTRRTLLEVLEALLRSLHPIMPFITEEIWQRIAPLAGRAGPTVMLARYPRADEFPLDETSEREVGWIRAFILAVRQIRGEMNISPSRRIPLLYRGAGARDRELIERHHAWLERLAGIESPRELAPGEPQPQAATALVGELTLLVPMADLIDAAAEAERLGKLLARAQTDLEKTRARLGNDNFVRNAPEEVVAAERGRQADLERTAAGLAAQLERVQELLKSGAA
jgi:valyl-tRNA synthetase